MNTYPTLAGSPCGVHIGQLLRESGTFLFVVRLQVIDCVSFLSALVSVRVNHTQSQLTEVREWTTLSFGTAHDHAVHDPTDVYRMR